MNPNRIELEINGERIGFKFGLGFLGRFLEETGITVDKMSDAIEGNPFKILPAMMHIAYSYNEIRAKREPVYTEEDFIDFIDDSGGFNGSLLPEFLKGWQMSMTKDVPKTQPKKKPAKKIGLN